MATLAIDFAIINYAFWLKFRNYKKDYKPYQILFYQIKKTKPLNYFDRIVFLSNSRIKNEFR